MANSLPKRQDVEEKYTWDLTHLYNSEAEYNQAFGEVFHGLDEFAEKYKGQLNKVDTVVEAIKAYSDLSGKLSNLFQYSSLPVSTDVTDQLALERSRTFGQKAAQTSARFAFFEAEISALDEAKLDAVAEKAPDYAAYIRRIKKNKPHLLSQEAEAVLSEVNPLLNSQLDTYETTKLADMSFSDFTVNGETYPLSYQLYEDYYAFHPDKAVRHSAFEAFSSVLKDYKNTNASLYYTEVLKDKTMANLRGYDSVFDYLLADQEIDREWYDRQIDGITTYLAPVMQKYAKLLKEENNLDEMTYADLKMDLDPEYELNLTIEEARSDVKDALDILGDEYVDMIDKFYDERWIDFVRNEGKQTGGFCSSSYGKHPYILMTWNNKLSDAYTLIHELGHAGQGILANRNNPALTSNPSMYIIEAPSTFHELLLTENLKRKVGEDDPRKERFVLTNMMANTYFHNYVTHLLEAAYQREVYRLIDDGKSFGAEELSAIKRQVLEDFWGEDVIINEGAELTWMRQPHYYMGLYPYTYSASLTVSTQAFLKMQEDPQEYVPRWLEFLTLGDSKTPAEQAKVAGVDITTDQPLRDTIAFLDQTVDRMIELS